MTMFLRSWATTRLREVTLTTVFKVVNYGCAIHLFTNYVGTFSIMTGPSMFPTFAEWDIVVEDCLSVRLNLENLARGDLVTLKSPIEPTKRICKRVIGLPGDTVCVDPTGQVLPSTEHVLVPKGHIWIAGDNATISRDSRHYGPVSMSLLHSKVVARVWPLNSTRIFRNPMTYIE